MRSLPSRPLLIHWHASICTHCFNSQCSEKHLAQSHAVNVSQKVTPMALCISLSHTLSLWCHYKQCNKLSPLVWQLPWLLHWVWEKLWLKATRRKWNSNDIQKQLKVSKSVTDSVTNSHLYFNEIMFKNCLSHFYMFFLGLEFQISEACFDIFRNICCAQTMTNDLITTINKE